MLSKDENKSVKVVVGKLKSEDDSQQNKTLEILDAFHPCKEVEVVSDKSAADETHIHLDEPLQAYSNRGQEVKFELQDGSERAYPGRGPSSLRVDDNLELIFHRTVRMPDDDRLHSLPASVGKFPLYNTADYVDRLPENIAAKGGIFLPMWQREALWIELSSPRRPAYNDYSVPTYAIRVYVGQINAVSGKSMTEERGATWAQDYLIFPGQAWIDGICVAPGVVRQFVAMPLGSGYTVEGQKTGEEKHGGLQIEVIPAYRRGSHKWLTMTEEQALRNRGLYLNETKTPNELGLHTGAKLRAYPPVPTYRKPVEVGDLLKETDGSGDDVAFLEVRPYSISDTPNSLS
ncbi:uncharacterized protein N7482_009509 [Penicillium canariense]|uniref:Integral membrane protein n=1 Tax=Penicillium canariense TaxID=189055 RepID=A0A9W9HRD5_9EURO|nr:uncharacterized protein N7482_009509 [Penicillium canariense]KAJ5153031.1 integral membrane protein [Penicillium canariense]